MTQHAAFLAVIALVLPAVAGAAVADSASNGFTVKLVYQVKAAPDETYRRVVHNVGDWWESDHTFSGDAHNLSIDDKAMGCFCEKIPGGSVRHLEVVYASPGKKLVMVGGMGPMQTMAVSGSMSIVFTPAEGGTKVEVTYTVAGYSPTGLTALAPAVDSMLSTQFSRLKNLIDRGDAAKSE